MGEGRPMLQRTAVGNVDPATKRRATVVREDQEKEGEEAAAHLRQRDVQGFVPSVPPAVPFGSQLSTSNPPDPPIIFLVS